MELEMMRVELLIGLVDGVGVIVDPLDHLGHLLLAHLHLVHLELLLDRFLIMAMVMVMDMDIMVDPSAIVIGDDVGSQLIVFLARISLKFQLLLFLCQRLFQPQR